MRDVGESERLSVSLSASGHYLLKIPTLKVPLLSILPRASCPEIIGYSSLSLYTGVTLYSCLDVSSTPKFWFYLSA